MSINNQEVKVYNKMNKGIAEGKLFCGENEEGKSYSSFVIFEKSNTAVVKLNTTPTQGKDEKGYDIEVEKKEETEFTVFAAKGCSIVETIAQMKDRLFAGNRKMVEVVVEYTYKTSYSKEKGSFKGAHIYSIELLFSEKGVANMERFVEGIAKRAASINEILIKKSRENKPNNHARTYDGAPIVPEVDTIAATDNLPF